MTTLLGTACTSTTLVFSTGSARCQVSPPGFPSSPLTPPSLKKDPRSSLWGSSCRLPIPVTASTPSITRLTSRITTEALFEQQEVSKKGTSLATTTTTAREARSPSASLMSSGAEETPSTSYSSRATTADVKAWMVARAARKTTRRRALAICLALAGLSQHGASSSTVLAQDHSSDSQARDMIRVSQSTVAEAPVPTVSSASGERYGDLVTVSTGSDSSNDGKVKGLPSWMGGNYHLCMGDGFHVQLPSDWHMHDTQGRIYGTILRYEDKADPSTNVVVLRSPTSQPRTGNLGNPEDWIREQAYLLSGSNEPLQFQSGDEGTDSARTFPRGTVSIAKVLSVDKPYKQGLTYYNYEILTKQGREQTDALHELVSAVVNNGNLYMCRVQTGEGRWQEDSQTMAQRIVDSFQITGFKIHV